MLRHIFQIISLGSYAWLLSILFAVVSVPIQAQGNYNYRRTITMLDESESNKITEIQYYDGFGRPTLAASNGIGGSGKYVYSLDVYDGFDRVVQKWLPVVGSSSLSYKSMQDVTTLSQNTYSEQNVRATFRYDTQDRMTAKSIPGDAWTNKMDSTRYVTNGIEEVKRYCVDRSYNTLMDNGYYSKGTLTGTVSTDADNNTLTVFTDLSGRKILERRANDNDTYYVYDDRGLLRYVLSPMYQEDNDVAKYAYVYNYDALGNLNYKKVPGQQPILYAYDKTGHLSFVQDFKLREEGKSRFMLYDQQNRLAIQGTCDMIAGDFVNGHIFSASRIASYDGGFFDTGYAVENGSSIAHVNLEIVNFYDDYSFLDTQNSEFPEEIALNECQDAHGFMTGQKVLASNGEFLYKVLYYDTLGNISHIAQVGLKGRLMNTTTEYTFTGLPQSSATIVGNVTSPTVSVNHIYAYNSKNNQIAIETSDLTCGNMSKTCTMSYIYDDLGRLHNISRPENIGNVNYSYNLHGWTTGISTHTFGEQIYYANGNWRPYYNGKISGVVYRYLADDPSEGMSFRGYKFSYDYMDRVTESKYGEGYYLSANSGLYDERTSYDANGNIISLERCGQKQDNSYGIVDDLHYSYNGNLLESITEYADPVIYSRAMDYKESGEYTYDDNGSLISDSERGITDIQYDTWGNPRRIQFSNGSVTSYVYSALGEKLRAIHKTAVGNISLTPGTTLALTYPTLQTKDSVDYLANGIIELKNGSFSRYRFNGGYFQKKQIHDLWNNRVIINRRDTLGVYHYNCDHLGNICEVLDGSGNVVQRTGYYPFGLPYFDNASVTGANVQPYKYNGKEFDTTHGLNWYDYGARNYNAAIGRWTAIDPLCEKYYSVSPYVYCYDNPIRYIDPNGDSIAVLNVRSEHLALLIQDKNKQWKYYSVNGNNVYISGYFSGGRKFDDLGDLAFQSPAQFLKSENNKEGGRQTTGYKYVAAFVIPTSEKQDNIIREEFIRISTEECYSLNPLSPNHCTTAVQRSLNKAGIETREDYIVPAMSQFQRPTYLRKNPYFPSAAYKAIIKNNPNGYEIKR